MKDVVIVFPLMCFGEINCVRAEFVKSGEVCQGPSENVHYMREEERPIE